MHSAIKPESTFHLILGNARAESDSPFAFFIALLNESTIALNPPNDILIGAKTRSASRHHFRQSKATTIRQL
jgi:hypothetical protein